MSVLRIEITTITESSAGSVASSSDLPTMASIVATGQTHTPLKSMVPISFFMKDLSHWDEVVIHETDPNVFVLSVKPTGSSTPTEYPLTINYTDLGGGVVRDDITIPSEADPVLQACLFVNYEMAGAFGVNYGPIYTVEGPGGTIYQSAYDFFSSTTSYIRGEIVGSPSDLFDSSVTVSNPAPDDYFGTYTSALMWSATPDIFWTQRVLCEET